MYAFRVGRRKIPGREVRVRGTEFYESGFQRDSVAEKFLLGRAVARVNVTVGSCEMWQAHSVQIAIRISRNFTYCNI